MTTVFPNIALMGKARSGKDTIAAHLISRFSYARVAFADPLKEMAVSIDPIVSHWAAFCDEYDHDIEAKRLSEIVIDIGWERAKDEYPEVRRFLIKLGTSARFQDENFWLRIGEAKLDQAHRWGIPAVVTDVRFPNEYHALKNRGFKMVRVLRPGLPGIDDASETGLDNEVEYPTNAIVTNVGTLDDLRNLSESLAKAPTEQ
ncbi:deoxynucleotide monophosphate kinase family protein [Streptomyces malaysiensis]